MHSHPLHTSGSQTATPQTPRAALVGAATLFVVYFAALHLLIVRGVAPWLTIGLIVGPWVAALATTVLKLAPAATRRARALRFVVVTGALGLLAWIFGDRLAGRVDVVLYVENLAFLVALSGLFAVTLSGAREPLITRLARTARGGRLPPQAVSYTRGVTVVWAAFFATMAVLSTLLFVTQSRVVWSTFVNLSIWPSMAVLFAIEYAVRVRMLRDIPHVPMMSGIDAFRQHRADPVVTAVGNE